MSRVPLNKYNLTSLAEDLRVLRLLPEETQPLSEGKSKKKDYMGDYEGKDYDYGDKMKKKDESEDADLDLDAEEAQAEDQDEVAEAAEAVLEAFFALSEDEVEQLDDSYLSAVEEAADALGIESPLQEYKRMSNAQKAKMEKARRKPKSAEEKKKLRARRKKYAHDPGAKKAAARWRKRFGGKSADEEDNNNLDNIIERLRNLTTPLTQESDEVGTISDKIVEGLKGVFYSANELAQRAALELSEADFDEDDPRYQLGVFFESIASDAKGVLDAIFNDQDIPMEDAIEDLQAMAADLKKGLRKAERIA